MNILKIFAVVLLLFLLEAVWAKIKTGGKGRKPPKSLSDIPTELILQIATHLSPVPRVCLALTCKQFLNVLGGPEAILDISELHHPEELTGPRELQFLIGDSKSKRMELLRLLEDRRRCRLCVGCQTLHPVSEFLASSFYTPPREERSVHIRPRIKMTSRDKRQLIEQLQVIDDRTGIRVLTPDCVLKHKCEMRYGETALRFGIEIHADTTLSLHRGELLANTKYTYQIVSPIPPYVLVCPPRQCCPRTWVMSFSVPDIVYECGGRASQGCPTNFFLRAVSGVSSDGEV